MRDYRVARARMVREQLLKSGIADRGVLEAMGEVPRHRFIPRLLWHRAYQACALPIGYGQTISQPVTVGLMTALLELQGDERVLEIGTGSGYQAAILARLAAAVISIERITALAVRARQVLLDLGCDNVEIMAGDGSEGAPLMGPFDAILVTACADAVPDALLQQLAQGGRLLLPLRLGQEQVLHRYCRDGDRILVERSVTCRFVPLLRGLAAEGAHG